MNQSSTTASSYYLGEGTVWCGGGGVDIYMGAHLGRTVVVAFVGSVAWGCGLWGWNWHRGRVGVDSGKTSGGVHRGEGSVRPWLVGVESGVFSRRIGESGSGLKRSSLRSHVPIQERGRGSILYNVIVLWERNCFWDERCGHVPRFWLLKAKHGVIVGREGSDICML